tara:strand:- start:7380 stop:7844 length:465 start_codon:yes stop_codon:yes gene_type:complete
MSDHISALTGEVVNSGQSLDVFGNVLTTDTISAYDLAHKYNKSITALVNGQYVGWGYTPSFIYFKHNREKFDDISEITYWGDYNSEKHCRYHAIVLIACGGYDPKQFYCERSSDQDNEYYWTHVRGSVLSKSKTQKINFKSRHDDSGFTIKENK